MQSTIWPETLFPIGNSRKLGPRTQSGPRRKSDVYEGGAREDSLGVPQGRSVRPCRLQEPPCRRTSQRCSGSRGALGRFRTSSARRHPSAVYHSLCPGARSSPPSFPGGLAKVTARGKHTARAAPPVPGARPSCLNCSIFRAHDARFPVITRTTS